MCDYLLVQSSELMNEPVQNFYEIMIYQIVHEDG